MEQVGDGDINTSVDMGGSIANDFKDGGNSVGDDHTDIALMGDQGETLLQSFLNVATCGSVPKRKTKMAPT